MRRPLRSTWAGLILATLALGLGACGGDDGASSEDNKRFNRTDVRFVQQMLPHHMQALRTSAIEIGRGKDPRVKALAIKIFEAQKREIAMLERYLRVFGARPDTVPPDQQAVWDENVAAQRATESPEQLDTVFLTNMVPHHAAAIPMSQTQIEMGRYGPALKLAEQIKLTQRMEIAQMNAILREKG